MNRPYYRLRVAQVIRAEEPGKPAWQAQRLNIYNDPAHRPPRYVMAVQSSSAAFEAEAALAVESFTSLYREGEFLHVVEIASLQAGLDVSENCRVGAPAYHYRLCEVERDYTRMDRAEAPQFYPPLAP